MNTELRRLAQECDVQSASQRLLCLKFGFACVGRVEHLLEEREAIDALQAFAAYLDGKLEETAFRDLAAEVLVVANRHRGSRSMDGSQHAAVSATYALANAINCKPVDAAEYAAYAKVYAYGGYAVNDSESFVEEYQWQSQKWGEIFAGSVAR